MTLLLLSVAGLAAAVGTRAAALPLAAAAVLGAVGATLPAATTWVAAMGVGFVLVGTAPRRLAMPLLGAAAALAAGFPQNAAVVLALWVVATGAAVLARPSGPEGRRWALTLCVADFPFFAAVAWTATHAGFQGWPGQLGGVGAALLLLAAVLRAPLASGPSDDATEPGLLTVRAQAIVAITLALGAGAGDRGLVGAAVLAGAGGFALGGAARRGVTRDAVQELSLLILVVGSARMGWGPAGWEWGTLAAGTLIHCSRLKVNPNEPGLLAAALLSGPAVGLPFLPVVVAALEGSMVAGGWRGTAVMVGLVGGLGARALAGPDAGDEGLPSRADAVVRGVVVAASIGVALWAPLVTLQPSPVVGRISWPPLWAGVLVVSAALAGARRGDLVPEASPAATLQRWRPGEVRIPAALASGRGLAGTLLLLAALAVGMWVFGIIRGFL